jgi:hypothetical protein
MLVDEYANRWIMQLLPPGPPILFPTAVNMLFPRSGTTTYKYDKISVCRLNVLRFEHMEGAAGHTLAVHDISKWHDDGEGPAAAPNLMMDPSVHVNH